MRAYPVTLTRDDNDTWLVDFPDFPEAHTYGETKEEALVRAEDALATVIDAYIKDRRQIPQPTTVKGLAVRTPALVAAKLAVYEAMLDQNVRKIDLARALRWHLPQVDRLLDVHHGSRLDQIESALIRMGKRLVVGVEDVPQRVKHLSATVVASASRSSPATAQRRRAATRGRSAAERRRMRAVRHKAR